MLIVRVCSYSKQVIEPRRLMDSVDTLLTMENEGGGFASYEKIRGPIWLELLNHAEVFGETSSPPDPSVRG